MKQASSNIQGFLPLDIALKIASTLEVLDVCALGSCSRFWRELCGSDCVWEFLTRERWPLLTFPNNSSSSDPVIKGWREIYIKMHREMAGKATTVVEFVENCSSSELLEVGDYYKAIEDLCSMQLSFRDVQMFLFKPKLNVLLNLVGLHYCIFCLQVPHGPSLKRGLIKLIHQLKKSHKF
uniref:F-box domain-containing protein n=1 Tax=Manihot esculenta TaxID=3983 RepID=A0A2C9UBW6_MANES